MSEKSVLKRRYHAFLSHAHVDRTKAEQLYRWLRDTAAVPVWYDAVDLPPGASIATALSGAIENSRSMILLLSRESVSRGWVQQEYEAALNHQAQHRDFRIIPIRLDDVSPPGFLQNYSNIALNEDSFDATFAAGVLKSLYQPRLSVDPINGRNTYLSRGWHPADDVLADDVCRILSRFDLQLIGDAQDQPSWVEARVDGIIEGCGAFVAILPYRPESPQRTSKYILQEWTLAEMRGLPCLVIADPRLELAPDVMTRRGLVRSLDGLPEAAATFADDWRSPSRSPHIFYATDFAGENQPLRHVVKELLEAITIVPCVLGEYVRGTVVQREILRSVAEASLVLADITEDSPNVYVEIGAARAANVPLFLLRKGAPGRPAFMLRDQQVWDYGSAADLLARIARIAYPFRRTAVALSTR